MKLFFVYSFSMLVLLIAGCSKSEEELREEKIAAGQRMQKVRDNLKADQQAAEKQVYEKMKADRDKAKADYEVTLQKKRANEVAYANNEFGTIRPNSPEFKKLKTEQKNLLKKLIPSIHEGSIWEAVIFSNQRPSMDSELVQLVLPDLITSAEAPSSNSYAQFRKLLFNLEPTNLGMPLDERKKTEERLSELALEHVKVFEKMQLTPEERVQVWLQLQLKPTEQFDALMQAAEIMLAGGSLNATQQSELKNHPVTSRSYGKFAK